MARTRKTEHKALPSTPQKCPRCGCEELVLHGAIRGALQQMLHNGCPVGERTAVGKRDIVWERLSCVRCGAECQRADERILKLQEEVELLQFQLAAASGRLVSANKLPC